MQVRRGLLTVIAAIADDAPQERFYGEMAYGFGKVVKAIEYRYHFPRSSRVPLGHNETLQALVAQEPPAEPLAQSSQKGIG